MNTHQLNGIGWYLFGCRYLGTFALNGVPAKIDKTATLKHFIINTQTSNLPGQHWVAVTIQNNTAYIFDSFGNPPKPLLVRQLKDQGITKIYYNKRQIQPYNTTFCGQLAVKHLLNVDLLGRTRGVSSWKAVLH